MQNDLRELVRPPVLVLRTQLLRNGRQVHLRRFSKFSVAVTFLIFRGENLYSTVLCSVLYFGLGGAGVGEGRVGYPYP